MQRVFAAIFLSAVVVVTKATTAALVRLIQIHPQLVRLGGGMHLIGLDGPFLADYDSWKLHQILPCERTRASAA